MNRAALVLGLIAATWILGAAQELRAGNNDHFASRRKEVQQRKQQQQQLNSQLVRRPWGGPTTHPNWWTTQRVHRAPRACWCGRSHCGHHGRPHSRGGIYYYNYYYFYPYSGIYTYPGFFIPY
jgi:hypothetical protein